MINVLWSHQLEAAENKRDSENLYVRNVRRLLKEGVPKLEKEAAAEATEKAFCDKEMAETTAQKEDKTAEVEKLTTKIDVAKARSAKLKEEVATLTAKVDLIMKHLGIPAPEAMQR